VKKIILFSVSMFIFGCANMALQGTTLRHEQDESSLLTKAVFMDRASQSATVIYEGMLAISEAANQYAIDNDGNLPSGGFDGARPLLIDGGYLKEWPVVPPFAFADPDPTDLKYSAAFADMDGIGAKDAVVYAHDLKIEVCEEFIKRYSSFGPGDVIHDYEANRRKAPGEMFGRHMKVYAMTWESMNVESYCDALWIIQYND
jgi:hypothetical protein